MQGLIKRIGSLLILGGLSACMTTWAAGSVDGATVPMQLELNRPYIDVTLTGPSGQPVHVLTWVDTGGGAIIVTSGLAQKLGLKPTAKPQREEGELLAPSTVPQIQISNFPVQLYGAQVFIDIDARDKLNRTDADMALPGRMLRHYVVELDYPARRFTIAVPGKLHPAGVKMKTYIGASGMPVVWLTIAGTPHAFLMDTGGQFCMMSDHLLHALESQHPEWRKVNGAYGPANMLMGKGEAKLKMLRIGRLQWGSFQIRDAGAVSRPYGNYEKFMSRIAGQPVLGSIAGNILREFRISIDYPAGAIYLERSGAGSGAALDMVGITLEPSPNGGYEIAGMMPDVHGVEIGDQLMTVDGQHVSEEPFYKVVALLSGNSGEVHRLGLLRNGKPIMAEASVQPIF